MTEPVISIEDLIDTREKTHGDFADTGRIAGSLKRVLRYEIALRARREQPPLSDGQIEALDLIATKIARILSGNPAEAEHWLDIGGYAKLGETK